MHCMAIKKRKSWTLHSNLDGRRGAFQGRRMWENLPKHTDFKLWHMADSSHTLTHIVIPPSHWIINFKESYVHIIAINNFESGPKAR